ncbi:unnamed protein product [Rotaria magnacalcarata]|uniref:Uncharacterized protein n=1 Tax=Rotaria magnacalcarata TaxID=392030 RepID=A0A815RPY4_9BILA|nr:unnamed protein product [Rotaria magnacalcarata]CAF1480974.1 unnamed protein product [Rotaria magnacalcarata]
MSILVRLKNKLQDSSLSETKIREFDECMLHLKTENGELHKRIDQLEAFYKTSMRTQQTHFFEEHIRQLEQENERLFVENQCQRQEYERFLDQLTTMVIRTAVMQENIREECASIYHIIERLSVLTITAVQTKDPFELIMKQRKKSLSWENLNKSCECCLNHRKIPKLTKNLIHSPPPPPPSSSSSSSNSSSIVNFLLSTSDSWTHDRSFENKSTKTQILVSNQLKEEEQQQVLQRSETFIISKLPQEELSSSLLMTVNDPNSQHSLISRTIAPTKSPPDRPSKLSLRGLNSKTQASNNNRTSLLIQKVSKLPIRTTNSVVNQQSNSLKKSHIPISTITKTKTNVNSLANRSVPQTNNKNMILKKTIRPPATIQPPPYKIRSRVTAVSDKSTTKTTGSTNKFTKANIELAKSNAPIQHMNSTSSDSSIEEQENINKLLSILQDEGYSTWSSIDVKDDGITRTIKKIENNDKQENIGLVNNWLDTSKRSYLNKPVPEVENNKHDEKTSSYLYSSMHKCYTDDTSITLTSTTMSSSSKDISLDSLDSPQSKEQVTPPPAAAATFCRSETYDKVVIKSTLPVIIDDLDDSTSSASSTCNMSDYIEDNFIDENDSTSSDDDSASYETTIINKKLSLKPQKRLLFPGLLNRLVFFRRVLSDSDLQQKKFYINENENQYHVYHSNIINEHSVEINLMNTYGSDSELHAWSNNCAEQRTFLNERQQAFTNRNEENDIHHENYNQQLAIERQILLQQIYEYPWLLQENDLDRTTTLLSSTHNVQTLGSSSSDLIVPTHNPDFYQLCALTNSSSFVISYDPNGKQTTSSSSTTPSVF